MNATNPTKPDFSDEVQRYLASGGRITRGKDFEYRPYRETPRRQDPEIAARQKLRAKELARTSAVPKDMYGAPYVMSIYGFETVAYGYRRFIQAIERKEIPEPDLIKSAGPGKFLRFWWKRKIDKHVPEYRAKFAEKRA